MKLLTMKLARKHFFLPALILLGIGAWIWLFPIISSPVPEPAPIPKRTGEFDELLSKKEIFSIKIFQEVVKRDFDKNIFISPFSIDMALLMAYNGAREETEQAIASTLEISGEEKEFINSNAAIIREFLENIDPKVQLSIANSLWMAKGISFKEEFIRISQEFYDAETRSLDFSDSASPKIINNWVKEKTNGKIDKIIDGIAPDAIAFIINAVYFKGDWTYQFDKDKTKNKNFTLLDGTQKNHPMMSRFGDYEYFENESFQAINLPYGDERLSMYVFLPRKDYGLNKFYQDLTPESWKERFFQFKKIEGTIILPRFTTEYEITLNNILEDLGMGIAFDKHRANFRDLATTEQNIFIQDVRHKTFVKVNEEGTEAAAVTSIGLSVTSVQPTFSMIVDRPFFFVIRDNELGTILFMGSIVDPQE